MKRVTRSLAACAVAFVLCTAVAAGVQEADGYEPLSLPAGWERVEYKDGATIGRVEYIYNDRSEALLKIKRTRPAPGEGPKEIADRDLDKTLRFLPGYLRGRTEPFGGGNYPGLFTQFDFSRGGKPMLGRHYYLKSDDSTVWVLQFTGDRTILGHLRNVTDQIARGFKTN
jgi:hypothetical protein